MESWFAHKELAEVSWLWVTSPEHAALTSEVAISASRMISLPESRGSRLSSMLFLHHSSSTLLFLIFNKVVPHSYWIPQIKVAKCSCHSDTKLCFRPTALHQEKNIPILPTFKKRHLCNLHLLRPEKLVFRINSQALVSNLETLSSHIANYCTYFLFPQWKVINQLTLINVVKHSPTLTKCLLLHTNALD